MSLDAHEDDVDMVRVVTRRDGIPIREIMTVHQALSLDTRDVDLHVDVAHVFIRRRRRDGTLVKHDGRVLGVGHGPLVPLSKIVLRQPRYMSLLDSGPKSQAPSSRHQQSAPPAMTPVRPSGIQSFSRCEPAREVGPTNRPPFTLAHRRRPFPLGRPPGFSGDSSARIPKARWRASRCPLDRRVMAWARR